MSFSFPVVDYKIYQQANILQKSTLNINWIFTNDYISPRYTRTVDNEKADWGGRIIFYVDLKMHRSVGGDTMIIEVQKETVST